MLTTFQQQYFVILAIGGTDPLAIQCPKKAGQKISLQTYDKSVPVPPSQLWSLQLQRPRLDCVGFSFVNPATNLSVTYNGVKENSFLYVAEYNFGSVDRDAWLIVDSDSLGRFRIAYANNRTFSWNVYGEDYNVDSPIVLWDDTNDNSLWTANIQPL